MLTKLRMPESIVDSCFFDKYEKRSCQLFNQIVYPHNYPESMESKIDHKIYQDNFQPFYGVFFCLKF